MALFRSFSALLATLLLAAPLALAEDKALTVEIVVAKARARSPPTSPPWIK
jgi:hypothetical protein